MAQRCAVDLCGRVPGGGVCAHSFATTVEEAFQDVLALATELLRAQPTREHIITQRFAWDARVSIPLHGANGEMKQPLPADLQPDTLQERLRVALGLPPGRSCHVMLGCNEHGRTMSLEVTIDVNRT